LQFKKEKKGAPGWLSWLSIRLLISRVQALHWAPRWVWNLLKKQNKTQQNKTHLYCEKFLTYKKVTQNSTEFLVSGMLNHNCSSKNVSPHNPEVRSRISSIISRKKEDRKMILPQQELRRHIRMA